jgi:hypothetical protein
MKMISSTSMTSTIGVTLMSETTGGALGSFISLAPYKECLFPSRLHSARETTDAAPAL